MGPGRAGGLVEDPLPVTEGRVNSVAFSPDGQALAAGYNAGFDDGLANNGGVVLWDLAARRRLVDLPVNEGEVDRIAFSPDGQALAASHIPRLGRRPPRCGVVGPGHAPALAEDPLPVTEGNVHSVAFSPDGQTLAAGCGDVNGGGVVLWDLATRRAWWRIPSP